MTPSTSDKPCHVGFFSTQAQADRAVRNLLAAGFSREQIAVICPGDSTDRFAPTASRAEPPGSHGAEAIVEGGVAGAALGGVALVATALATGGIGLLPAIPVLIGGGAFAGGFINLILSDGYGKGVGEFFLEAIQQGKIVVGVEGEDSPDRLQEAERILAEAGADSPTPKKMEVTTPSTP